MHKASTLTKIIGKLAEIDVFFLHIFSNENILVKMGELYSHFEKIWKKSVSFSHDFCQ